VPIETVGLLFPAKYLYSLILLQVCVVLTQTTLTVTPDLISQNSNFTISLALNQTITANVSTIIKIEFLKIFYTLSTSNYKNKTF